MESVGTYLKNERENRNISLEEVADATKVNINVLRAIEEGEEDKWPAQVFVQGFIRCYATYIGLDPAEALQRYKKHVSGPEKPELEPFEIPEPPKDSRFGFNRKFGLMLLSAIVILFSVSVILYLASKPGPPPKSKLAVLAPKARPLPVLPRYTPPQTKTVSAEIANTGANMPAKSQPSEIKQQHVLQSEFKEDTWIQVGIGSQPPQQYFFRKGQNFVWKTDQDIKLRIGNAGGVDLTFDGKTVKSLGKKGQVVIITLPNPNL